MDTSTVGEIYNHCLNFELFQSCITENVLTPCPAHPLLPPILVGQTSRPIFFQNNMLLSSFCNSSMQKIGLDIPSALILMMMGSDVDADNNARYGLCAAAEEFLTVELYTLSFDGGLIVVSLVYAERIVCCRVCN